jgi:hypothetical protein
MIQIKIDDNEIKNKINQIKNNKKLIINKIGSILVVSKFLKFL